MRSRFFTAALVATATFGLLGVADTSASNWAPVSRDPGETVTITGTVTVSMTIGKCMAGVPHVPAVIRGATDLSALDITGEQFRMTATCAEFGLLGEITDVAGVYTTASGDKLRSVGHGSEIIFDFDSGTAAFTMTNEFTGGAGVFVGAHGSEVVTLLHDFATDTIVITITATVHLSEQSPAD